MLASLQGMETIVRSSIPLDPMTCGAQPGLSDRNPQHLEGQALAERVALQQRSRALWQPPLLALARRVGLGVDARSQTQRMLAVLGCDPVDTLIPPRHRLKLKPRAQPVKRLIVTCLALQAHDSRRSERLGRLEMHTLLFL
jgi:hypothetical protein